MIRKSVAEILDQHVTVELEAIDRMYLNGYVPSLQRGGGVVYFMKTQLGARVPSTAMVAPMSHGFVAAIERFVKTTGVDLVTFEKNQRKDDVAQTYRAAFAGDEGVLFVGKAQEKASVFRTDKRRNADGSTYPWIIRSTTPVNHYYFYLLDRDFGPLFIKFCSYFPYAMKICLNGHEWLKRQLTQRGIAHEPLDNGIRSSDEAARVQRIADTLDAAKIDAVVRKWLRRLPHPFTTAHRAAGYRYQRRVLALMQTLCLFALSPTGFRHRDVRTPIAQFLGRDPDQYAAGRITYDLRRLRLHGLIDRVPHSHRYRLTDRGARLAILYVRVYARGFRPAASLPTFGTRRGPQVLERVDAALTKFLQEVRLVA